MLNERLSNMINDSYSINAYNKKNSLKNIKRSWQLFMFLILPLVYLVIFHYVPMAGVQIAFRNYTIKGGIWGSQWVGFMQFVKFFNSYQFVRVLCNTLYISFYHTIAGFPFPIIFALLINAMNDGLYKKFIQTATYFPHFISVTVLVGMIVTVFNPRIGLYGVIGQAITGSQPVDLLAQASVFPHMYVWSGIWQNMGWSSIIYIAALSGSDNELHEAAQIDGASRFKRTIHIDLPTILPTATVLLILSAGNVMSVGFEKAFLMQNNLNISVSEVISTYVYKVGLNQSGNFSYASAIGLFNSVINMSLLLFVNFISRRFSSTSLF